MMHRFLGRAALALAAVVIPLAVLGQSPAETVLREGLLMERAEGRLQEAIFRYERVVAEFPSEREVVAQALHRLALAYEQLENPRAALMWSRLATAGPNPFAEEARERVESAQQAGPESPFPIVPLDPDDLQGETVSPDGRWLAYYNWDDDRLHLRDRTDGTDRLLVDLDVFDGRNHAWSPDSRQVAFSRRRGQEIGIVTIEDGTVRFLGQSGYPRVWTLGDELLAYRMNYPESSTTYWLIPAGGGEARLAYTDPFEESCGVRMTPDGRSLVFCRSERLVVRDLISGTERPVTNGTGEQRGPQVSHDGRLLAFRSNDDGGWALFVAPLDRIPVDEPVRIATIDGASAQATWIGDSRLTLRLGHEEQHVYRVDVNPATGRAIDAPRRLTQDTAANWNPAVSPDSSRIAYFARENGLQLSVMDANGSNERPLLEQGGSLPVVWRSASEILFRDFDSTSPSNAAIAALDVNTGTVTEVARVEGLYWWYVPARQEILHMQRGSPLMAFSLAEGRDREVAAIYPLTARLPVSPDGRRFATTVAPDGQENGCDLVMMSLEGTPEGTLLSGQGDACPYPLAWSPDGRFLLVGARRQPQVQVMDVATRDVWPLHPDMASQDGWWADWAWSWSPDGSFITLTRESTAPPEQTTWSGVTYEAVTRLIR